MGITPHRLLDDVRDLPLTRFDLDRWHRSPRSRSRSAVGCHTHFANPGEPRKEQTLIRVLPFVLLSLFTASGVALWWYGDLSVEDRAKADAIAAEYAARLYRKALGELSRSEARHVQVLTRRHFAA